MKKELCPYWENSRFADDNSQLLLELFVKTAFDGDLSIQFFRNQNLDIVMYWKSCPPFPENIFSTIALLNVENSVLENQDAVEIVENLFRNGLPDVKTALFGIDGITYFLKIHSQPVREFGTWCEFPEEWNSFRDLVSLSLKIIRPESAEN